jgi:hypothetical protein
MRDCAEEKSYGFTRAKWSAINQESQGLSRTGQSMPSHWPNLHLRPSGKIDRPYVATPPYRFARRSIPATQAEYSSALLAGRSYVGTSFQWPRRRHGRDRSTAKLPVVVRKLP